MPSTGTEAVRPALEEARELGFLGPGPVEAHLRHALGFATAWGAAPPASALDLGSGGGVPGLVLALHWPASRWVLLDANERRTAFLERWAATLAPGRIEVVRARAEDLGRAEGRRAWVDLVTARGFGPPAVTAECAAPLLRRGGRLVVSEPPEVSTDRWPAEGLAPLGLVPLRRVWAPACYEVLEQRGVCPPAFPRRVGVPAKRPLFLSPAQRV